MQIRNSSGLIAIATFPPFQRDMPYRPSTPWSALDLVRRGRAPRASALGVAGRQTREGGRPWRAYPNFVAKMAPPSPHVIQPGVESLELTSSLKLL